MKPKADFKKELYSVYPQPLEILQAFSDEICIRLFMRIGLSAGDRVYDSATLMTKLRISKKRFYTKIFNLQKCGLVKRINQKYYITAFGKVVLQSMRLIEDASRISWKLKVLDAIEPSKNLDEGRNLINTLIDSERIKIILKSKYSKR
ncbi:MAG TPA: hypothetical protein VF884_00420 [Nitrososphaeraceae archaeon]